jgi:hypothetical protein
MGGERLRKGTQFERGVCVQCEKRPQKQNGKKNGQTIYKPRCQRCDQLKFGNYKRPHKKHKKDHCESCKFKALHSCQLDVDHIDGNNKNNSLDNLQTLCANCHRLKTIVNGDHLNESNS